MGVNESWHCPFGMQCRDHHGCCVFFIFGTQNTGQNPCNLARAVSYFLGEHPDQRSLPPLPAEAKTCRSCCDALMQDVCGQWYCPTCQPAHRALPPGWSINYDGMIGWSLLDAEGGVVRQHPTNNPMVWQEAIAHWSIVHAGDV